MKKAKRLTYDPCGLLSDWSPVREAAMPLDLRDFREGAANRDRVRPEASRSQIGEQRLYKNVSGRHLSYEEGLALLERDKHTGGYDPAKDADRVEFVNQGTLSDLVGSGMQTGLPFMDEVASGITSPIRATKDWWRGEGFDIGRAYHRSQALQAELQRRREERSPIASRFGSILGGAPLGAAAVKGGWTLLSGARPTVGSIAIRGGAEAAAYGSLYGAGEGNGFAERAANAVTGAEIGGVLGFAAPYVGRAAGAGGGKIMDIYRAALAGEVPSRTLAKVRRMFDRAGFNMGLNGVDETAAAKTGRLPNRVTSRNFMEQADRASDGATVQKNQGDITFDPPKYPQRPFRQDYPNGAEISSDGKLAKDIDGRDLTAKYVAGRVYPGRPDVRLREKELRQVIRNVIHPRHEPPRKGYYLTRKSHLDQILGKEGVLGLTFSDRMGQPRAVFIANHLNGADIRRVLAHEAGHVLHETGKRVPESAGVVRDVPENGIEPDMFEIYHGNRTGHHWPVEPEERWASLIDPVTRERKRRHTPLAYGYPREASWREYVAEALGTYMTAPNTMKTLWPEAAARLRAFVNEHEELKKFIQLNGLAGLPVIGLANYRPDDRHAARSTREEF